MEFKVGQHNNLVIVDVVMYKALCCFKVLFFSNRWTTFSFEMNVHSFCACFPN